LFFGFFLRGARRRLFKKHSVLLAFVGSVANGQIGRVAGGVTR
jgi:hypothetical protein